MGKLGVTRGGGAGEREGTHRRLIGGEGGGKEKEAQAYERVAEE